MSVRTRVVLLLVGCLGGASSSALAQAHSSDPWEIEVHGGGAWFGTPSKATTALPPPGDPFVTVTGRPSRIVSSWYFGDGTALFNEWAAAFTIVPRLQRLTSLDPVLTQSATKFSNNGSVGLRVGRRLTPRLTAEVSADYRPSRLELSQTALDGIEASRASFENGWKEELGSGLANSGFVNAVVSSTSEIDNGSGGQIVTVGALTVRLRHDGPLVPYATGGLGAAFNNGRAPNVTLKGHYTMSPSFNPLAMFDESDTVVVQFARPNRALVGMFGGGFTYDVSRRHGVRVDFRVQMSPNQLDTLVSASPFVKTGTPAASTSSATTPTVVFSNRGPSFPETLSGPAITAFRTHQGSGVQFETALTVGYFLRF